MPRLCYGSKRGTENRYVPAAGVQAVAVRVVKYSDTVSAAVTDA